MSKKCYRLSLCLDNVVSYGLDTDDVWQAFAFEQSLRSVEPKPADWVLPRHCLYDPDWRLLDFISGYSYAPFVSQRVYDCLGNALSGMAQFVSIGPILDVPYYLLNVTKLADCLDANNSEFVRSPDDPNRILYIKKYRFQSELIPDSPLFRIPQNLGDVLATNEFIELVLRHRLTGVDFQDVEKSSFGLDGYIFGGKGAVP